VVEQRARDGEADLGLHPAPQHLRYPPAVERLGEHGDRLVHRLVELTLGPVRLGDHTGMRRQVVADRDQGRVTFVTLDLDPAEPGAVRAGLRDQHVPDSQAVRERMVRMRAEDQVDRAGELACEHVVRLLPVLRVEPHVREQHDELRALRPQAMRHRPDRLDDRDGVDAEIEFAPEARERVGGPDEADAVDHDAVVDALDRLQVRAEQRIGDGRRLGRHGLRAIT
jgi:hypothetical protein